MDLTINETATPSPVPPIRLEIQGKAASSKWIGTIQNISGQPLILSGIKIGSKTTHYDQLFNRSINLELLTPQPAYDPEPFIEPVADGSISVEAEYRTQEGHRFRHKCLAIQQYRQGDHKYDLVIIGGPTSESIK